MYIMSLDEKEFTKIGELKRYSKNINTIAKVVSKTDIREVTSRRDMSKHRVCEALIGDETGSINLVLWDKDIDSIDEGLILKIKNGFIKLFRGSMQLNIGRLGSYEFVEEAPFDDVKTENNLSEKVFEQRRFNRPFGERSRGYRRY